MTNEFAKIKKEVNRRCITRLCHFTQSRKLLHILTDFKGIISTEKLKKIAPDTLDVTDNKRFDGFINHICCSIEYPNTWYFNQIKNIDPLFKEWVIILIKPNLIWREGTQFSPVNASTGRGVYIKSDYSGFVKLFQPAVSGARGRIQRRTKNMLSSCPTDDQAEVLVLNHIPVYEIIGVVVPNEKQAVRENIRFSLLPNSAKVKWYISPDLFTRRWSDLVRQGKRPIEKLYKPETEK